MIEYKKQNINLHTVRFSSTLIFFTELILVFAALFIICILVMSTLQCILNRDSWSPSSVTAIKKSNVSSPQQQTQLLLLESHSVQMSVDNQELNTDNDNIFLLTYNKTKNITIWSYLVYISSLLTIIWYLLMYTTIITPNTTSMSCNTLSKIANILLILSRFTLYFYWNEYLLYCKSVYISYYIHSNDLLRHQYPNLKPIKSLNKFKKRMHGRQHDLNQDLHNRYSDGEQYLYYKICFF